MKFSLKGWCRAMAFAASALMLPATALHAADGIYPVGYGLKAEGLAGAGVAHTTDITGGLNNPAGIWGMSRSAEIVVADIWQDRSATVSGSAVPTANGKWELTKDHHRPEAWMAIVTPIEACCGDLNVTGALILSPDAGISCKSKEVFPLTSLGATQPLEVEFQWGSLTPMVAGCLNDCHKVGFGMSVMFGMVDVANFTTAIVGSNDPGAVTDKGKDYAWGWGLHAGYLYQPNEHFSLGVAYRSKSWMAPFRKYRGIFSPNGRIDLPPILKFGMSYSYCLQTRLLLDFAYIFNKESQAFGDDPFSPALGNLRGVNAGLAYRDQAVWKVGVEHELCPDIILRAGYNHCTQIIHKDDRGSASFACPITTQHNVSLGGTYSCGECSELTIAWVWGIPKTLGTSFPAFVGGGNVDLKSQTHFVGLGYKHFF